MLVYQSIDWTDLSIIFPGILESWFCLFMIIHRLHIHTRTSNHLQTMFPYYLGDFKNFQFYFIYRSFIQWTCRENTNIIDNYLSGKKTELNSKVRTCNKLKFTKQISLLFINNRISYIHSCMWFFRKKTIEEKMPLYQITCSSARLLSIYTYRYINFTFSMHLKLDKNVSLSEIFA